jgi:tetratricopeptide (TPR) repeat protein
MKFKLFVGAVAMAALAVLLPAPALAQVGGVSGRVVDATGKPAPDVDVVLDSPTGLPTLKLKTNAKGEYFAAGVQIGDYRITATKGTLTARIPRTSIRLGQPTLIPDMKLGTGAPAAADPNDPAAKKAAELALARKNAENALDAGNFDEAIVGFTKVAADTPKCVACYVSIGRAQLGKKDQAAAEAAFKQAIEADPAKADGYNELASLYNTQKKFDLANEMSTKAGTLMASSPGGGDPVAVFNQGVILWNQGKAAEAQAQFEKVTQLEPRMADAHYFLGMTLVNQNKMAEAKKSFDTYMSLAPTGSHADEVKALLAVIK